MGWDCPEDRARDTGVGSPVEDYGMKDNGDNWEDLAPKMRTERFRNKTDRPPIDWVDVLWTIFAILAFVLVGLALWCL